MICAQHPCEGHYTDALFPTVDVNRIQYGANLTKDTVLQNLHLDVYTPTGNTIPKRPLIIFIHGGSFTGGNLQVARVVNHCQYFAQRGYVTASLEYRLGIDPSGDPIQYGINWLHAVYRASQDAKAAIRFFRAHPDTFQVDTSQIFIGGFSAGGATAIHAAYWDEEEVAVIDTTFWGSMNAGSGNAGFSSKVTGILSVGAAIVDTTILDNDIPSILVHGLTDGIVPIDIGPDPTLGIPLYGSRAIVNILDGKGTPSALKVIPENGFHVPAAGSALEDTVQEFFRNEAYLLLAHNTSPLEFAVADDTLSASNALNYHWWMNGDSIVGTNSVLIADTSAWYHLEIINLNGCRMKSDSVFVEVMPDTLPDTLNTSVLIQESATNSNILISYDVEHLKIRFQDSNAHSQMLLELFSLNGQNIFQATKLADTEGIAIFKVPSQSLTTGIYIYSLTTDSGEVLNGKIWLR